MRTLLLIASILALASCGPTYQTFYDYKPMKNATSKRCANDCIALKQDCQSIALQDYNSCQTRAEIAYQSCEDRKYFGYNKKGEWECLENCYCFRESCSENSARCEESYKECYVNCGGTVVATTQCVSNCEEAAAPSRVVYGEQEKAKSTKKPAK